MSTPPEPLRDETVSATFHLTHACNLRCTYCYTGEKVGKAMPVETAEAASAFVMEQARSRRARHLEVVFFGGEPLLKPDLIYRICDRLTESVAEEKIARRLTFKMSTNGLLLSREVLDALVARGVFISISLDGDPSVQDAQRPDARGRGTSERLKDVIERLLTVNPCANVTCVATPAHADRLDRSVRWLFSRGFRYVSTTLNYGEEWTRADLRRLEGAYRRLADWYVERTLGGEKLYLSCFDEKIRTRALGPLGKSERCSIGTKQFSIAPSGRLYPCVQFVHEDDDAAAEWVLGDVWGGFEADRRSALASCADAPKDECSGCAIDDRCASWCACVNWQSTGRVDRTSPLVCEHERILMPIADEAANRLWKSDDPTFVHKHYNPAFPVISFAEHLVMREVENADVRLEENETAEPPAVAGENGATIHV